MVHVILKKFDACSYKHVNRSVYTLACILNARRGFIRHVPTTAYYVQDMCNRIARNGISLVPRIPK